MGDVPEEAGKVATSAIESLKSQPGLLALILLNAVIFVAFGYLQHARQENDHAEFDKVLDACYDRLPGRGGPH